MDNPPHETAELTSNSTTNDPQSAPQGSVMFSGNQCFTVTGGTFTSITNHPAARVPSDFRMIPLGDIDLRHEIQVDRNTGVVGRQREQTCIRRIYIVKVEGRMSNFTAAVYQGNGAEEEWRRNIAKHIAIRHPNIIQIYGTVRSGGIYATLYHDELVPFHQFLDSYRYSHFATVYFYACCIVDFHAANNHVSSTFQQSLYPHNYTAWIRLSSGQLCADLIPSSTLPPYLYHDPVGILYSHRISSASDTELMVIESLITEEYHNICFWNLSQFRMIPISTSMVVNIGAIIACSSGHPLEDPVEIANTPNVYTSADDWESSEGAKGAVMEDGWTRFKSDDIFNGMIGLRIWCPTAWGPWLSQANNIFRRLRITSNFEDYVLVDYVFFELEVSGTTKEAPAGFLFLSPPKNFKTGPSSFRWPDSPAYWSLNLSGIDRLTLEEATRLGFPTLQLKTTLYGDSWDASVYEGLRKFHQVKGFNPNSLDLARHLQYPLHKLLAEADSTFAHVNEGDFEDVDQEDFDAESRVKSDDPQTEASVSEDVDGNVERFHVEEDDHDSDSVRAACGSDHFAKNQEPPVPNANSAAENGPDSPTLHTEMLPISETFKVLIAIQLALILFLGLSWLYEHK